MQLFIILFVPLGTEMELRFLHMVLTPDPAISFSLFFLSILGACDSVSLFISDTADLYFLS